MIKEFTVIGSLNWRVKKGLIRLPVEGVHFRHPSANQLIEQSCFEMQKTICVPKGESFNRMVSVYKSFANGFTESLMNTGIAFDNLTAHINSLDDPHANYKPKFGIPEKKAGVSPSVSKRIKNRKKRKK